MDDHVTCSHFIHDAEIPIIVDLVDNPLDWALFCSDIGSLLERTLRLGQIIAPLPRNLPKLPKQFAWVIPPTPGLSAIRSSDDLRRA